MMRSNPSRKYGKPRLPKTPHVIVGTNHSSTFKTNGSVAGTTAKSIATTDQPDSMSFAKPIRIVSPDFPEKPDLHISPESTDEEKRLAWNRIKERSPDLSLFLNMVLKMLGKPNEVMVIWLRKNS